MAVQTSKYVALRCLWCGAWVHSVDGPGLAARLLMAHFAERHGQVVAAYSGRS